ncbi:Hypothetical predicted protein [Pelobates cultripes]|uniref:Uncharacterized protein n=1 Tax=Pelobates cultripes TaxID=61616 RepID=A0AAD1SDW8_PELCU|nr:Hypothetical predicted protein [Pelobates cultripes]
MDARLPVSEVHKRQRRGQQGGAVSQEHRKEMRSRAAEASRADLTPLRRDTIPPDGKPQNTHTTLP